MAQTKFKGNPVETSGELPPLHSKAANFCLIDKELKERTLADFKNKKKILSLVPSLDTAVCSLSTKKFNESAAGLPNTCILVISVDTPFAQNRMCGAEGLDNVITLSMIRDKEFAKSYGMLITTGPLTGFIARAIVVLDENDQVIYSELVPEITQEPNYEKALAALG